MIVYYGLCFLASRSKCCWCAGVLLMSEAAVPSPRRVIDLMVNVNEVVWLNSKFFFDEFLISFVDYSNPLYTVVIDGENLEAFFCMNCSWI